MTIKELSKYQSIKLEIKQLTESINEITRTYIASPKLTGMPQVHSAESSVESALKRKEELIKKLERKEKRLIEEHLKIENYLDKVEESEIRYIIRSRFIEGKTWGSIAKKLNFSRTAIYYHLNNYLKSHE